MFRLSHPLARNAVKPDSLETVPLFTSISSSLKYMLSPSGGVAYHLIAARRHRHLWRPFRAQVRDWIAKWREGFASKDLIVFGPSAGWTLPLELFIEARKLVIIEPDPIARRLLEKKLASLGRRGQIEWISDPAILPWFSKDDLAFESFLATYPHADLLFANVLGQVALHASASTRARKTESPEHLFLKAVKNRSWASYHDLYSGPSLARLEKTEWVGAQDFETVAESSFTVGPVTDHETQWLSQTSEKTSLAVWPITEKQTHIIAWVSHRSIE